MEHDNQFVFPPRISKLSLWDLACMQTGQNATDDRPTNETRHRLAELAQEVFSNRLGVEWSAGTDFDFVTGFMPAAKNARVDTEWRALDRVTVRREDWARYTQLVQQERIQKVGTIRMQETLWELRQPAFLFGDGFSGDALKLTTLSKYLDFETWTPETAALLVSGLQAPIPCNEIPAKGAMGLDNCFIAANQDPFHHAKWVLELWRSRENAPSRVRPLDFITWCKSKNVDTAWLQSIEGNAIPVQAPPARENAFSDDDRQRFLKAQYWTERELLALCLGVPKYADRDDIAPEVERESARATISAAIQSGQLPAEKNPSAGPGEAVYGGIWQIEPTRGVRWAIGKFHRLPEWLTRSHLQEIYALQDAERQAAGRFTLHEAAQAIAATGERLKPLEAKLRAAAENGDLPVYGPGELARYRYGGGAPTHSYYEEAYWDDLNSWLEQKEPRITYRFSKPAAAKSEGAPTINAHGHVTLRSEVATSTQPVSRHRSQEAEILRVIRELGYDPSALPRRKPGRPWVKSEVKTKLPQYTPKVFAHAWDRLRLGGEVKEE